MPKEDAQKGKIGSKSDRHAVVGRKPILHAIKFGKLAQISLFVSAD